MTRRVSYLVPRFLGVLVTWCIRHLVSTAFDSRDEEAEPEQDTEAQTWELESVKDHANTRC